MFEPFPANDSALWLTVRQETRRARRFTHLRGSISAVLPHTADSRTLVKDPQISTHQEPQKSRKRTQSKQVSC